MEALAQEVAPFGAEVTIVEPGGARTEFTRASLQVAEPLAAYAGTPAAMVHAFKQIPVPGDPAKIAAAVIASMAQQPAPLRLVLGSDSYQAVTSSLRKRLAQIEPQQTTAAQTDANC